MRKFSRKDFFGALSITLVLIIALYGIVHYQNCRTHTNIVAVKGASLQGIVGGGEQVRSVQGYYTCHDIARGDLVEYAYGNALEAPLVKVVRGMPGDHWRVYKNSNALNVIEVNGQILTTSYGAPYELDEKRGRLLNLYVNDYHGVIPQGAYLIMGNLPNGTLDSSAFGLVAKGDIVGKVFLMK
jgi:signal peptidase I